MANKLIDPNFLSAVELIHDAASDPSVWPAALHAIALCLKAAGAVLIWDRDDGNFGTVASTGIAEAQRDYVENGWLSRDIRAIRSLERGYFFSGEPFADRHVCSAEELATDPFYTEFLAKHELGWFGAVAVSPDPRIAVALSVQRSPRDGPQFDEEELNSIERLGRYVEKSLRLSIRLIGSEISNKGLADALANLGVGIFVIDSLARVVFSNPIANSFLSDTFQIEHDRLRVRSQTGGKVFDEAIFKTLRANPLDLMADPSPILIHRNDPHRPLLMYPMFLRSTRNLGVDVLSRAKAILVIIEPKADEPAEPALVRDFFGLTLGEARVASLVGAGVTPRDASVQLGIAEETVRNVLKRVFTKTGVGRQAELVALVTQLSRASSRSS